MNPLYGEAPRPRRVLVADDDDDLRAVVAVALRRDGHEVIEARSGHELLERVVPSILRGDAGRPPDIIVSDIQMPGIDGLSVLAGLRDTGWATPIVFMSGYVTDAVRARAAALGAAALMRKPFDVDELRAAVASLVTKSNWRAVAPTLPDL